VAPKKIAGRGHSSCFKAKRKRSRKQQGGLHAILKQLADLFVVAVLLLL
jgi:hypothetical protein